MNKKVIALADKWGANGNFKATVNGSTLFDVACGYADRERGIAYTEKTRTYVASVTKQFTAVCVMMLRERRLIDIEAPLRSYAPEYVHGDKMTLRQLLNMTSGIPNELWVIAKRLRERRGEFDMSDAEFERMVSRETAPVNCSPEDFLEIVNVEPLLFEPGEKFDYSDTNYMLLGEIIARVSGLPYAEFMRRNIFEPLGMKDSIVGADNSDVPSYAEYDGKIYNMGHAHFVTGEGSICTTAADLCKWLNAVIEGRFISGESWQECFTPVNGYGFGYHIEGPWRMHGGGDLGYSSMVWVEPERHIAIAGAMNMPAGGFYKELFELVNKEI